MPADDDWRGSSGPARAAPLAMALRCGSDASVDRFLRVAQQRAEFAREACTGTARTARSVPALPKLVSSPAPALAIDQHDVCGRVAAGGAPPTLPRSRPPEPTTSAFNHHRQSIHPVLAALCVAKSRHCRGCASPAQCIARLAARPSKRGNVHASAGRARPRCVSRTYPGRRHVHDGDDNEGRGATASRQGEGVGRPSTIPEVLKACIPGCQTLEKTSDTSFTAAAKLKIGPVSGDLQGQCEPQQYRSSRTATGSRAKGRAASPGFAKGGADVTAGGRARGRHCAVLRRPGQCRAGRSPSSAAASSTASPRRPPTPFSPISRMRSRPSRTDRERRFGHGPLAGRRSLGISTRRCGHIAIHTKLRARPLKACPGASRPVAHLKPSLECDGGPWSRPASICEREERCLKFR